MKAKSNQKRNWTRLYLLLTIMGILILIYLPTRQHRLDIKLIQAVSSSDVDTVHSLLESGADPNIRFVSTAVSSRSSNPLEWIMSIFRRETANRDRRARTMLILAANSGNSEMAHDLLAHGADVRQSLLNGTTALHTAASHPAKEIVQLLLQYHAPLNGKDNEGMTPLLRAAKGGCADNIRLLLDAGADLHVTSKRQESPFFLALQSRHLDAVKLFLEQKVDIQELTPHASPVLLAAQFGSRELMERIWQQGGTPFHSQEEGAAALTLAAQSGSVEAVRFLLDKEVPINGLTKDQIARYLKSQIPPSRKTVQLVKTVTIIGTGGGITGRPSPAQPVAANVNPIGVAMQYPLFVAMRREVVDLLLERGADTEVRDGMGYTRLMREAENANMECIPSLLKHGAKVNTRNKMGQTALILIAGRANYGDNSLQKKGVPLTSSMQVFQTLLQAGADVHAKDNFGKTVLMNAFDPNVVRLLLAKGVDVHARDNFGKTALMYARNATAVSLLLAKGADVQAKDKQGHSTLFYAVQTFSSEVINLLLKQGAKVDRETLQVAQKTNSPMIVDPIEKAAGALVNE